MPLMACGTSFFKCWVLGPSWDLLEIQDSQGFSLCDPCRSCCRRSLGIASPCRPLRVQTRPLHRESLSKSQAGSVKGVGWGSRRQEFSFRRPFGMSTTLPCRSDRNKWREPLTSKSMKDHMYKGVWRPHLSCTEMPRGRNIGKLCSGILKGAWFRSCVSMSLSGASTGLLAVASFEVRPRTSPHEPATNEDGNRLLARNGILNICN